MESPKANIRAFVSGKTYALATLSLFLFLIGIVFKSPAFVFSSFVPFTAIGAAFLTSGAPDNFPKIERTIEKYQVYEKEACKVRLRVENPTRKDIDFVQVRDLIPQKLDSQITQNGFTFSLKAGETHDLVYTLYPSTFGEYSVGPILLEIGEGHGFFSKQTVLDQRSSILVLPEALDRLTGFSARPRKTKPWPGETPSKIIGSGANYNSIRPMIPGESLRRVNWRASARTMDQNTLLVNEFRAELGSEVMLVVDARTSAEVGEHPMTTLTYSTKAAISIADRLLKDRDRVGLMAIGETLETLRPGYGRRQLDRIVLSLINLKSGSNWTIENLPNYIRFFFPNISQVILFSSLADKQAMETAIDILRGGYDVTVISPNPVDIEKDRLRKSRRIFSSRSDSYTQMAISISTISRKATIEALRSMKVLVVDWRPQESLENAIEISARVWSRQAQRPGMI